MAVLNHAGISLSYTVTWDYLRQLTTQARYLECVRDGHWQWVYDNVNIRQAVRHEQEGMTCLPHIGIRCLVMLWGKVEESEKAGSHHDSNPGQLVCTKLVYWLHKPGVLGSISGNWWPFHFPPFLLKTSENLFVKVWHNMGLVSKLGES